MNFKQLAALTKPEYVNPPPRNTPSLSTMKEQAKEGVEAEIQRIIELPKIEPLTPDEVDIISRNYLDPVEGPKYGFNRLLPSQAQSFVAYGDNDGAFLPISVGGGKTLAGVGIANDAFRNGHKKVMMIVPANLVGQLADTDVPIFRKVIRNFNLNVHNLTGTTPTKRASLSRSNRLGLYVFSYELLSRAGGFETLEAVAPSCIICDEAHNIAGQRKSARAKRFWAYADKHNPQLIAMSGTITRKSPADYHRISRACLKDNNFLPNAAMLAEAWGSLIDSNASSMSDFRNDNKPKAGPIMPLMQWARTNFPEEEIRNNLVGFRKAFKLRLRSCPGVVSSGDSELGVSLTIDNNKVPNHEMSEGWGKVEELVDTLNNEWLTPNGDEIEHAMHIWKWRYEIEGAGFYNELFWPEVPKLAERKRISEAGALTLLERSQDYHCRHQDFARELRKWINNHSRPGLDSPMLVGGDMHRHGSANVGSLLFDTWQYMKDGDFDGRIDRDGRAVRVCGFKIEECARYIQQLKEEHKREGALIWYHNQEMGRWICEEMEKRGVDFLHCPAGAQHNRSILDPKNSKKVIAASMRAHGTGKNLQAFGLEYYLQWPRDAVMAEQSLGRIHRNGQLRDSVKAVLCLTTEFDRVTFSATLNDSCYIHQSTGNAQRLIYADYSFKPEIVPYTVMQEWGTQTTRLDTEAQGILSGKFGDGK